MTLGQGWKKRGGGFKEGGKKNRSPARVTLGHRWNFRHMGEALGTLFRVGITGEYAGVCSRMLTYAHVC